MNDVRPSQVGVAVATAVMGDDYPASADLIADYCGDDLGPDTLALIGAQAGITVALVHLVGAVTGEPPAAVMEKVGVTLAQTSDLMRSTRDD